MRFKRRMYPNPGLKFEIPDVDGLVGGHAASTFNVENVEINGHNYA